MNSIFTKTVILFSVLSFSNIAFANIEVSPLSHYMSSVSDSVVSEIKNTSNAKAYVTFELEEVFNPRTENEESEALDFSDSDVPVLATPSQVVIPPNDSVQFRVFDNNMDRSVDRFFRVIVSEVRGSPLELEQDLGDGVTASLNFSLAYSIILVVPKREGNYLTHISKDSIENRGDGVVLLKDLRICEDTRCSAPYDHRLFPNEKLTLCFSCIKGSEAKFTLVEGRISTEKSFVF